MFKKIELWIVALLLVLFSMILISYAAFLQLTLTKAPSQYSKLEQAALFIADIPSNFRKIIGASAGNPLILRTQVNQLNNYKKGYLLVSAFSKKHGTNIVYLYDLKREARIHQWLPPIKQIQAQIKNNKSARMEAVNFRTLHPLVSKDGTIVFSNGRGPLVKLDVCSNLEWVSDRYFHHSIELNSRGNLIVPIVTESKQNYFTELAGPDANPGNFQDDAFAEVSMENGKVLSETSITKILIENKYHNLVLQSLSVTDDLIHLNDAEPINFTDGFVREGDIMLSMRNTSSVALYRPSMSKIVWLKQGPWRQQHDIDYQGNGVFTIFGNDSYQNRSLRGYSIIYSYDMKAASATEFLALKEPAIFAGTEGLHQIISANRIFIEETNKGIIHIMDREGQDQLRYISKFNNSYHSGLHWSRFINDEDLISSVKEAKANSCPN
ncbi:MAG: hypothetical protein HOA17_03855 [Candidatus Melainabacteria bacterium]|jgi:hypothetical protein|nr:hypothetical protein [Candidatus Melainabacteria bacterium]